MVCPLDLAKVNNSEIERVTAVGIKKIFGNGWLGSWSEIERGVDRIERSVLKNNYDEGGLNITDVDCLNKALKLRQYIRAGKSSHPTSSILRFCMEKLGYTSCIEREYD